MTAPSFLSGVRAGHPDFALLADFPEVPEFSESKIGELLDRLDKLLGDGKVGRQIDRTGQIPDDLITALREEGFLTMLLGSEFAGHNLSVYEGFRMVEGASAHSATVGMFLAIHNALGVGAFLPTMADRPLRHFIAQRVCSGQIAGMASTERQGAANDRRTTVAVATPDGTGYLISGEKLYISNGAIAGVLSVTATVLEDEDASDGPVGIFFIDTNDPGFSVEHRQRFMGLAGSPNAVIRFDRMYVSKENLLADPHSRWRLTPPYSDVTTVARSYITAAVSIGVAKQCVLWASQFASRRMMDGRPLIGYDAVQRLVADAAAEVYAMDCAVRWAVIPGDSRGRQAEFDALKNLLTVGAWRVVDAILSLYGGEGFETADSKEARGADPVPVEQAFRDLRGLRVAGGVDFNIDRQLGQAMLNTYYAGTEPSPTAAVPPQPRFVSALTGRNQKHLATVMEHAERLGRRCRELVARFPDRQELFERQQVVISCNRIADEIGAMSMALSRSAAEPEYADLADIYCVGGQARLSGYWHELEAAADDDQPAYASVASQGWRAIRPQMAAYR